MANVQDHFKKTGKLAGDVPYVTWYSVVAGVAGFTAGCITSLFRRRPILSGFAYIHVPNVIIGSFLGYQLSKFKDKKFAEKEYLRQKYVEAHPEKFATGPPKKVSAVDAPFEPIR